MGLFLEDLPVGLTGVSPARTVTEADVVAFSGLSGDYNPLHTDAEFAAATPYQVRIAHGALTLSIVTGLLSRAGTLDGTALGFLGIEDWRFKAPVKFGDTIHAKWEVIESRPSSKPGQGVMKRKVEVFNQRAELVQVGVMVVLVRTRP